MFHSIKIVLILLLASVFCAAATDNTTVPADTTADTMLARVKIVDSVAVVRDFEPNPTVATLLSAAIPGAGQAYSRAWWHVPFFVAAEGFFAYEAVSAYRDANKYWDMRANIDTASAEYVATGKKYDDAVADRNLYIWLFAGSKFLDIVDAYICAQLYGFERKMDAPLTLNIVPDARTPKVLLTIKF